MATSDDLTLQMEKLRLKRECWQAAESVLTRRTFLGKKKSCVAILKKGQDRTKSNDGVTHERLM